MKIIGEDLHIMNEAVYSAIINRDEETILKMAERQIDGGADLLDLNLGQNKKLGILTPWVVETIQGNFDVPLLLSSHVLKQQRALEIHKGTATINAVTANPKDLTPAMETAKMFDANLVVLLVSPELTPVDVNGRLELGMQVMETANVTDFPLENIYLDPVVSCRPDPSSIMLSGGMPDISTTVESIKFLGELSNYQMKTIISLSQSSMCMEPSKRSNFHCKILPILNSVNLDAVIMNCKDNNAMGITQDFKQVKKAA